MVVKKQTAWLLTMLSLIIVLSVYYILQPGESPTNVAYIDEKEKTTETEDDKSTETSEDDPDKVESVSNVSSDEMFAALRIKINEARDRQLAQYQEVVASGEVSAELKSEAYEKMEQLNEETKKISVLESLIANQFGFEDVIVNPIDAKKYNVIVKADSLSSKEANEIMRKTVEHLGEAVVTVEFTK